MEEEIKENLTKRVVIKEAEEILGKTINCLDHGFVRLVDYMGGDSSIVQAARVSYGKGTKTTSEDRGLIRYLMRNHHTTPLEMVEMKWHCKMPIFVARQWVRHRTASINEYSLRYSEPKDEFYIPKADEIRFQSVSNRQGSSEEKVSDEVASKVIDFITQTSTSSMKTYEEMSKDGIAKELARMGLPINLYTEWYWKNDLHNTLHFLKLRLDHHAQKEIRVYAEAMADVVKKVTPLAYEAFEDYVLNSVSFSALELRALRTWMTGIPAVEASLIIENKREKAEFLDKLDRYLVD